MIVGMGQDLVHISRVIKAWERHGERFARRLLAPAEWQQWQQRQACPRYLAKRFAAKEAAAKALGTGIRQGIRWQDFIVTNDALGKPSLQLVGVAQQFAERLGVKRCHISLSDERDLAQAWVIFED